MTTQPNIDVAALLARVPEVLAESESRFESSEGPVAVGIATFMQYVAALKQEHERAERLEALLRMMATGTHRIRFAGVDSRR